MGVKGLKMRWWLELGMGIGLYLTALFVNHIGRLNVMPNCFYGALTGSEMDLKKIGRGSVLGQDAKS